MDVDSKTKPGSKRSKKDNSFRAKRLAKSEYPERYYEDKPARKRGMGKKAVAESK